MIPRRPRSARRQRLHPARRSSRNGGIVIHAGRSGALQPRLAGVRATGERGVSAPRPTRHATRRASPPAKRPPASPAPGENRVVREETRSGGRSEVFGTPGPDTVESSLVQQEDERLHRMAACRRVAETSTGPFWDHPAWRRFGGTILPQRAKLGAKGFALTSRARCQLRWTDSTPKLRALVRGR